MLFAVIEDESKSVVESDSPLGSLAYFLDSFILEHLDEVFLNSILKNGSVLNDRCILNRDCLACSNPFSTEELVYPPAVVEEWLPFLLVVDVEAHQHWEVGLLDVDVYIVIANDSVDLLHWTHWVI